MIEQIMVPKEEVLLIPETVDCLDALEILEENNLRNAPVVDATEQLFRGNIYKYHIYKEAFHHGKEHLQSKRVTSFLKNTTRVVHLNDSIYQLIFSIKDLPYICILNENNTFIGIVYHDHLLNFLAEAWGANDRTLMLKIDSRSEQRNLDQLMRIILKYVDPKTFQLFQETDFGTSKHLFLVIGPEMNRVQINRLMLKLRQKNYHLTEYQW